MKKRILFMGVVILFIAGFSRADVMYQPPDHDIFDLDHYYAYTWGLDLGFSTADTPITEAVLTFTNINNWLIEDDHLYIHLLDDADVDLDRQWDGEGGGDYFLSQGVLLIDWNDPEEWNRDKDLVITFTADQLAALNAYGADHIIGFGLNRIR